MVKMYIYAHYVCAWVAALATSVLIDFPLKIIINIFFTTAFLICSILYPLIKKIDIKKEHYNSVSRILKYATSKKCSIAIKIKKLWDV